MNTSTSLPARDFAGFIDRFEARNLASIQRSIALQLSEMETRISLIAGEAMKNPQLADIRPDIEKVIKAFAQQTPNVVERLVSTGEELTNLLITHVSLISGSEALRTQLQGFVGAFIEAAEASHTQRLIDAALTTVKAFEQLPDKANVS